MEVVSTMERSHSPQESNYPHKPEPDAELLQNKIIVPKGSEYAIVLADGTKVK